MFKGISYVNVHNKIFAHALNLVKCLHSKEIYGIIFMYSAEKYGGELSCK